VNGGSRPAGSLSILLHAHLPFVRHPEFEDSLEERWLVEALVECYLPLLRMLEGRVDRRAPGRITISLSPTLLAMLADPLLRTRIAHRMERLLELSERDGSRYRETPPYGMLAGHYRDRFREAIALYQRWGRDLAAAFRAVEAGGAARLVTCGATHGYLPLMDLGAPSWRAQIGTGAREFERHIGHPPEGFWLPECGYAPGVEAVLAEFGVRWFVVDAHGILDACPRPVPGTYAPLRTSSGVLAFGRDAESSRQVWSSTEGYPGDSWYREYYRDQGFDLPLEDVREFLPSGGTRTHLGLKYHRITDRRYPHREPYDPARARARVAEHAAHFVTGRLAQARAASDALGQPAMLLAPYDAELFGHWWYEGPEWLDRVLDGVAASGELIAADPLEASARLARVPEGRLHPSSWGAGGYSAVWLDPVNDWIYRHLLRAAERMQRLARAGDGGDRLRARALRQAGRELLLAQASDWAFIMKTGTLIPYAVRRTETHLERFERLAAGLESSVADALDSGEVDAIEAADPIFPELDPGLFA
jgi:1,4-alpha-glucan branching enzyme